MNAPAPVTNHELARLLVEAGYDRSHAALARRVNHMTWERWKLVLRYDGASVYYWLRGRCPEQPAPELLCEILAERLGRSVGLAELGFTRLATADALAYPGSVDEAAGAALSLWASQGRPGNEDIGGGFVPAAAEAAGWRWAFDAPDRRLPSGSHPLVRADDVETLRGVLTEFTEMDRRYGGEHARPVLAGYLVREVGPLLYGSYSDSIGRELYAVAAELTGTLAYMAYDSGNHRAAQQAYTQALRLSRAAGNRIYGAHILANLATMAIYLNLPAEAVRLSRAALDGAGVHPPAGVTARLCNTAATAAAIAGDDAGCRAALRRGMRALDRDDGSGPAWSRYFTPAHLAGTAMRCMLDLGKPVQALRYADEALCLPAANVRTTALHTALTATAHAAAGRVDDAVGLGSVAAVKARRLRSRRVRARLDTLAKWLAPHDGAQGVAALLEEIQAGHSQRSAQR